MAPGVLGRGTKPPLVENQWFQIRSTAEFESHLRAPGRPQKDQAAGQQERDVACHASEHSLVINAVRQQEATPWPPDPHAQNPVG